MADRDKNKQQDSSSDKGSQKKPAQGQGGSQGQHGQKGQQGGESGQRDKQNEERKPA